MLKIENERDLITGGISVDQLKTVASLPLWGQKRPSIEECTCYIIGLIQSRLATLSDDEDNGETSHCKGICDYGVKIAEKVHMTILNGIIEIKRRFLKMGYTGRVWKFMT